MDISEEVLNRALDVLGQVLAERGQAHEVVAIGGGSLLLLGLIQRPTRDLDLVAMVRDGHYQSADPLPPDLLQGAVEVGRALGLADDWLNAGPTDLLDFGLPEGFVDRTTSRIFGALTVHIAGRFDQICFKLYASVDQGPHSKHYVDLRKLEPSEVELLRARAWCLTHDVSDAFADQLCQALTALGVSDDT